jgi:AraC-like DNA-binding protein
MNTHLYRSNGRHRLPCLSLLWGLSESTSEFFTDNQFMHRFYAILTNELANPAFRVEQLADELAVSHRTLTRKLVSLTGMNASQLMRTYRLEQAAGLLQRGATVSEAAEKTGFEGLSYFTRSFKAQFSSCPSRYRMDRRTDN